MFHNVCPYDGCEVVISPQSDLKEIETPYHGWLYALDGTLKKAGYWDGTPEAASVDLKSLNADLLRVPCHVWMQTVFVYLGNEPVSFEDQYEAVLSHFAKVDMARLENRQW